MRSKQRNGNSLCSFHSSRTGRGGSGLFAVLALVLAECLCSPLGPPVKDVLAVLVHLQFHDGHLAGVNTNIDSGTIRLFSLDPLNVDPELGTIALNNLANLLPLVVTSNNLNLVIFPDWHAPDPVLGAELLGEGGREVPLAGLAPVGGNVLVQFHPRFSCRSESSNN